MQGENKTMLEGIIQKVRESHPLVHNITNYVTANDCANVLLAIGASPIMADAPEEVDEITSSSDALVLNLGTPNSNRVAAMISAGKKANALEHPVVFDPVGIGGSAFRSEAAEKLLHEVSFTAIRGNISEIAFLSGNVADFGGVDAGWNDKNEDLTVKKRLAQVFAKRIGSIVVITGEKDVISDGNTCVIVENGHAMMSLVTGTGCMLSSLMGAFLAVAPEAPLEAVISAVGAFGLCGEKAYERAAHAGRGSGSYHLALIDELSLLKDNAMGGVRLAN